MDDGFYMARFKVDLPALHRWAQSRQMRRRIGFDWGYAMHHLLVESFGKLAPQPFRLTEPHRRGARDAVLHGYVSADARTLIGQQAIFADPLQAAILPEGSMQTKPLPVEWCPGRQLGFEVLVRPVIRQKLEGHKGRVEIDVYDGQPDAGDGNEKPLSREEAYHAWLAGQFQQHGQSQLLTSRMHSYQITRVARRYPREAIPGPSAVMRGTVLVGDPSEFTDLLRRGVGRHRAYGYGMLLLRSM